MITDVFERFLGYALIKTTNENGVDQNPSTSQMIYLSQIINSRIE